MKVDVPENGEVASLDGLLPAALRDGPLRALAGLAKSASGLGAFQELIDRARRRDDALPFVEAVLDEARIRWSVVNELVVPTEGPLVVVANHPFGVADGAILHVLVRRHRPDARTMATYALRYIPELHDEMFFVDSIVDPERARENAPSLRATLRHLHRGGALAIFPAGAMMRWVPRERRLTDPPWSRTFGGLVRSAGATVLPFFFHGRNRVLFNVVNALSRDAGLALMLREFVARQGSDVTLTAGMPIPFERFSGLDDGAITAVARDAVFELGA